MAPQINLHRYMCTYIIGWVNSLFDFEWKHFSSYQYLDQIQKFGLNCWWNACTVKTLRMRVMNEISGLIQFWVARHNIGHIFYLSTPILYKLFYANLILYCKNCFKTYLYYAAMAYCSVERGNDNTLPYIGH